MIEVKYQLTKPIKKKVKEKAVEDIPEAGNLEVSIHSQEEKEINLSVRKKSSDHEEPSTTRKKQDNEEK